jgi:hypothetical protein
VRIVAAIIGLIFLVAASVATTLIAILVGSGRVGGGRFAKNARPR